MLDIRQTATYAKYLKKRGWNIENKDHVNIFIKKIPFLGPVIKIQRPEVINYSKIKSLAKKHKAFQIIIEPKTALDAKHLVSLGFEQSDKPYLPTKTLYIDLTQSRNEITKGFRKETKRIVKKLDSLKVKEEKDIQSFQKAWRKAVSMKRHVPSQKALKDLKKTFKNRSLFLLSKDGSAGAIFLKSNGIAYYWQAFAGKTAREKKSQYKIVWEGIAWAKSKGSKIFDFEGIYDRRFPKKDWKGFSFFKKGFGGYEKTFPGTFVKTKLLKNW
jgi:lipid II:glycine glycyltransferase (peptidoglycan interpeptide bridge formation enzyme)